MIHEIYSSIPCEVRIKKSHLIAKLQLYKFWWSTDLAKYLCECHPSVYDRYSPVNHSARILVKRFRTGGGQTFRTRPKNWEEAWITRERSNWSHISGAKICNTYLVHQTQISEVLTNYGGWLLYIDKLIRPMPDFTCVSKPPKLHATGIKIEKATRQRGIKADNLQEVGWCGFGRLIIIIELTLPMRMKHLLAEGRPGPRYPLFSSSNS